MEPIQIDLYEFLTESELQHYYNSIKNELKISNASQFKYATDEDLKQIGLSRPEIRRLRKYYEKYFPHGYFSKIKRLLQAPATIVKREDGNPTYSQSSAQSADAQSSAKAANSPNKTPNNKHIIPADSICVNKQLGTGEFGIVQQGVWTNGSERIQVAIKCLCRERMQSNPMEFLKEAAIMHSIEHENIVRLYGVVLATDSLMLVTELAHLRSLLECLKDSGLRVSFLTIPTLCVFAMQICNGMKYLENKRLIHRDLAARNILVFSKNKVKISDFGLSRALGVGKDYYKTNFNVNLKLPIAWCAPECINYLRFTNASDVWAYGVCLWEMFSYGFQPWAALTGLQILEAIDAPNYQRLEQPECCPRDYYQLMLKCWQDDPLKRPKFSEIYEILPEIKPEQLKTVVSNCEPKKDHLLYQQGEIITVLERSTSTSFWKGVLSSGKTGFFNPANTVAYLEALPSSNRDSFCRTNERCSKRKLRTEMISKPQNDLKHTGHIGIDGESFGDVAFLANSQTYNHLPRQIVTPYKPSEDIEQTPLLLPPTPTSPDSLQTASSYFAEEAATSSTNPTFISSNENTPKQIGTFEQSSFDFSGQQQQHLRFYPNVKVSTNPFTSEDLKDQAKKISHSYDLESNAFTNVNLVDDSAGAEGGAPLSISKRSNTTTSWASSSGSNLEDHHEYHEISDDEITGDKFDFGPSLLDEINSMFGSMSTNVPPTTAHPRSPDFEHINNKNELTEFSSKLNRKNSAGTAANGTKPNGVNVFSTLSSKKKPSAGTVKPISVKDEKILNHAIEIANEISARSMTDLVSEQAPSTQSPKRKFSFRFPHLSHHGSHDKSSASGTAGGVGGATSFSSNCSNNGNFGATTLYSKEKKNFTEELKSIPDLQTLIGEEGREAYNSLIERKTALIGAGALSPAASLLSKLDTNEFELTTAKTLPRRTTPQCFEAEAGIFTSAEHTSNEEPAIPLQNAPRPLTLPTRGAAGKFRKTELMINSKLQRAVLADSAMNNMENDENCNITANSSLTGGMSSPCESPSYLVNTAYTFQTKNIHSKAQSEQTTQNSTNLNANPIPLPPRDGKKHIKTNPKRHIRKYPLIIPAYGVQRTLNKVTEVTSNDDDEFKGSAVNQTNAADRDLNREVQANKKDHTAAMNLRRFTHEVVAAVRPTTRNSASYENTSHIADEIPQRTYQNLKDVLKCKINEASIDSASLQFESILEDDFNKVNVLQSPDVTDGFYNFSIQKEHYNKSKDVDFDKSKISGLYANEDELRNLDIDKNLNIVVTPTATAFSTVASTSSPSISTENANNAITCPKNSLPTANNKELQNPNTSVNPTKSHDNELADHALFKKVRESVDLAMGNDQSDVALVSRPTSACSTRASSTDMVDAGIEKRKQNEIQHETRGLCFEDDATQLKNSNSVSCEDLLEFSDKKPKGCERGVDSDEVRIMMKVLGKNATPTRCLHVLEFIDWDVHKAIKLIKLQNILDGTDLSLSESVNALQKYEWDLQTTAMKHKKKALNNSVIE